MLAWSPLTLNAVVATGNLTQLYPASCTAGSGASTQGTLRRSPIEGNLYRAEIYPATGDGGVLELWDISGFITGATDNVDTGSTISQATITALVAQNRARLIWKQGFTGDPGTAAKVFARHLPIYYGLAARFIVNSPVAQQITLSIVASGCFRYNEFLG